MKPNLQDDLTVEHIRLWFKIDESVTDDHITMMIDHALSEIALELGSIYKRLKKEEQLYLAKLKICTLCEENGLITPTNKDIASKSVDGVSFTYATNTMGFLGKETCLQKYQRLYNSLLQSKKRPGILK